MVDIPTLLPALGSPVSTEILNMEALEKASVGERVHALTVLAHVVANQMSDPQTYHDIATFKDPSAADWSGFQSPTQDVPETAGHSAEDADKAEPPTCPAPPDNYVDSLPALGHLFSQLDRSQHVWQMNFARYLESSLKRQDLYLGAPFPKSQFHSPQRYLIEVMKISSPRAQKIVQAGKYFTHAPGADPELAASQPIFPELAAALRAGTIPRDNAERIMSLDEDLTKYSEKVGQPLERKNAALAAFESTLTEAAQAATPEELSKAKQRWLERLADWVCEDGPPPSKALGKQADNTLRSRTHSDGSTTFSVHATPELATLFKNFSLEQLKLAGTPVRIPQSVLDLIDSANIDPVDDDPFRVTPPTREEALGPIEHWDTAPDDDQVVAEDADGNPIEAQDLRRFEQLSTGQRIMAILIGMFQSILTMSPKDIQRKRSHGSTTQLILVQDIETAYQTLGIGKLPECVRRPSGPQGHAPPVLKLPNPDDANADPPPDPTPRPVPWTPYQSEAVNDGPIHPQDAEILACNSELVGQIWDGPDRVLQEKRTKRLFTPDQRLAILARDKGCQAPGCTMPAVYSEIHHIRDWLNNGTTDETNGIVLCAVHHGAIHNGKWTIRKHNGMTFFQPAPWLDGSQPLLRNVYWNS